MQAVTILGSTGSIGIATLDVIARHPELYYIYALTGHSRIDVLAEQCFRFRPQIAVVSTALVASTLQEKLRSQKILTEVTYGVQALCAVASATNSQIVMAAIVGAAGLRPILAAAKAGKKILLANKEVLVISGQLLIDIVLRYNATLLPIDSEHNAIFQCLPPNFDRFVPIASGIVKILLTASGGPFLKRSIHTLNNVTPEEAIAHPKWTMGRKISVDSATMMNKGLEVIEAHWLFGLSIHQIEVIIHPQSIIHSMVSYTDGSVLAQLSNPDMRTPIAHALAYPKRINSGVTQLDLVKIGQLFFERPDFIRFPCLKLAYDALLAGGSATVILNAANEIAVQAFLNKEIKFCMIDQLISRVMDKMSYISVTDIDALVEQDQIARLVARSYISS